MNKVRENAGYQIIEAIRIDDKIEVVLGQIELGSDTQYVTWLCSNGTDYFWGHYLNRIDAARVDLFKRAIECLGGE